MMRIGAEEPNKQVKHDEKKAARVILETLCVLNLMNKLVSLFWYLHIAVLLGLALYVLALLGVITIEIWEGRVEKLKWYEHFITIIGCLFLSVGAFLLKNKNSQAPKFYAVGATIFLLSWYGKYLICKYFLNMQTYKITAILPDTGFIMAALIFVWCVANQVHNQQFKAGKIPTGDAASGAP